MSRAAVDLAAPAARLRGEANQPKARRRARNLSMLRERRGRRPIALGTALPEAARRHAR
jgi:hypothetical protein